MSSLSLSLASKYLQTSFASTVDASNFMVSLLVKTTSESDIT